MPPECSHVFQDSDKCLKCGKSALSLTREHLQEAMRDLREWVDAAARVGIKNPGGMQQARHLADAAVNALGLDYDETAPIDIRQGIAALREGKRVEGARCEECENRAGVIARHEDELRESTEEQDGIVIALEHFMAELLDETVAAGELCRIVRSVRQTLEEGPEEKLHSWSVGFDALARELMIELIGKGPEQKEEDDWRVCGELR